MERKKRYLIIAMDMADLAAGIVFKRIVSAMADYVECDVLCPIIDDAIKSRIKELNTPVYQKYHYRLERWSLKKFGIKISEVIWSKKTYLKLLPQVKTSSYDAIISFVSAANLAPLIVGKQLSSKMRLPWVVYTVDAIPKPLAWTNDVKQRERSLRFLIKYLPKADALFAANSKMLDYVISCLNGYRGVTGVVLTPSDGYKNIVVNPKAKDEVIFLYAGQVYNIRRIGTLLKGFELFLNQKPKAKLVFVGLSKIEDFAGFEHLIEAGRIERYGFTNEIESFYQGADVLLDINGDVTNDVFLSSKICNYLSYNKPIIVISGEGSPVRDMMSGFETIVHCHHNQDEIYNALLQSLKVINYDYSEREALRELFRPETVSKQFCEDLARV